MAQVSSTQPLTELSTRNLPGVKGQLAHKAGSLTAICELTTATSADDTAVLASDNDPVVASHKQETNLIVIYNWLKMENKSQ
jgi:hypothetical protein